MCRRGIRNGKGAKEVVECGYFRLSLGSNADAEAGNGAITNSEIKYDEEEEAVDVCQAIQEMRIEERRLGEQEGERRGEKIGVQKGELKKAQEAARNFYNLGLEVDKIAQGLGYEVETVKGWLEFE